MIQSDGAPAGDHDTAKPDGAANGAEGAEHHEASTQNAGRQGAEHETGDQNAGDHEPVGQDAHGQDVTAQDASAENAESQDGQPASGTAIERAQGSAVASTSPVTDIEPFLAAAGERIEPPHAARPFHAKLLDYSAHAAMIVGLLGFAWTLSAHTGKQPDAPVKTAALASAASVPAAPASAIPAAAMAPAPDTAELRLNTQKMAADITALRLNLEALRSTMRGDGQRQDKTIDQIKALAASLDSVKTGLTATKTETTAALTQLSGKIDHLQRTDAAAKVQQVGNPADRSEHDGGVDQIVTASLAPAQAAKPAPLAVPPVKPQVAKAEPLDAAKKPAIAPTGEDAAKKPQIIPEWVVREVDDGVAIVESKRGQLAVETGATIPGAGVVKSIERHGASWTVVTSKGQLAYVPLREQQAPRAYPPRAYYRGGPEDY
ncbi:MAG: hypothetical protein P4L76_07185 [Beijerinckiaceae bacterium]|nr:hypothetical protein [Beijerinckiaceae bacterium]